MQKTILYLIDYEIMGKITNENNIVRKQHLDEDKHVKEENKRKRNADKLIKKFTTNYLCQIFLKN